MKEGLCCVEEYCTYLPILQYHSPKSTNGYFTILTTPLPKLTASVEMDPFAERSYISDVSVQQSHFSSIPLEPK